MRPTYRPNSCSHPILSYAIRASAWVGKLIDRYIKRRRLTVNETMMLDTLEAITTMVHYGLGVSIVPLRCATAAIDLPVRRVAFKGAPAQRVLGLVQTVGHRKTTLVEALLSELNSISDCRRGPAQRDREAQAATEKALRQAHKKIEIDVQSYSFFIAVTGC